MKEIILNIEGMTCSACSNGLERYLNKKDGINAVVNLVMASASIKYDDTKYTINDIENFIKEAGFKSGGELLQNKSNKKSLLLIIIFIILAILMMHTQYILLKLILSTLSIIWGIDIIKSGIKNIIYKEPNMDSLICISTIINYIYSISNITNGNNFFESITMVILFIKIGRYIDKKNKARAIDVIKNLVTVTPEYATILINKEEKKISISEISIGDKLICKPGDKIAVDGVITNGNTHTNESFITGESKPVSKTKGDKVLAGSINYDGYIEYEALKIGKDSSISHIVDLVVNATNTKMPISRLVDKVSKYFIPVVILISIISFILNYIFTNNLTQSIEALVTVLVVACPCALGLATPLASVISIGNASKNGILIKTSDIFEKINNIDTIVFDKTGTLTKGELEILDYKINEDYTEKEVFNILKSIESKSNHPIAKSISKYFKRPYKVDSFTEVAGFGINAIVNNKTYYIGSLKYLNKFNLDNIFLNEYTTYEKKGETIIYLWDNNSILGIFGLRDKLKDNIKEVITNLKDLNKNIVVLSGDNDTIVSNISNELSINTYYSNISPDTKVDIINKLNTNRNVLMIGDGINDSPALKTAEIGVSVSNGTDISKDTADIILLSDDMEKLVSIFKIGKRTISIIKENLFWAFFYNLCMIPLATCLLPIKINPSIASLAMVLSSLTVVLNSLRLKK